MNGSDPKVLVIRLSSLGDVVLASSVLAPLRRSGQAIFMVTKQEFTPLFLGHPEIAGVFAFDKTKGERAARESLFSWCAAQNISLVVDLQDSWRTRLWRKRLRRFGPVIVARKQRLREWLVLWFRLGSWLGFRRGGRAARFRQVVEAALGLSASSEPLTQLTVSEEELNKVRPLLPAGEFVALLPGSAWKGKEWPYFPALAKVLARRVPVVTLGSSKDLACDTVAEAASQLHSESRSLRGKTSIRESMAVLAQARWVIGNDTGMLHVAEALGGDVAMLEGPTHEFMGFSPYRPESALVGLSLACRPCSKAGQVCLRFGTRKCLYGLHVAEVADQLRRKGFPC